MSAMSLLRLHTLNKRYGALVVTDGVSMDVAKGEIVGILGPNGAGKTTLFNLIAGTVKADNGLIHFKGDDITRTGAAERCKLGISRSFQVPHPFNGMTVFENVVVGRHCRIRRAIIDKDVEVPDGIRIGYDLELDRRRGLTVTESGLVIIAKGERVAFSVK